MENNVCGIAGVISTTPLSETLKQRLAAAARSLSHRGPDGSGISLSGHVGLVHTRLAIVDLAGGHQPLETPDHLLTAVVNGEIYNHVELRAAARSRGAREPLTQSDSEAALHAYAADGVDGFRRLNGMFGIAIHDTVRRRLVLARDRLGIKPLYYGRGPGFMAFGSELRTVIALIGHVPELDPDAIAQFLEHEFQGAETTAFRGVLRVPPGHAMTIDHQLDVKLHRFWSLADVRTRAWTHEDAEDAFSTLMSQVMTEHMRADVPFGLFLSGGLDSGLLCSLLSRMQPRAIETFSVGYSVDRTRNELDAARACAQHNGTRHTALEVTPDELWRRTAYGVWTTDELMRDRAILPTLMLAERSRQSLKVVFTGEGGDEAFAGYARYRRHPLQRWMSNVAASGSGGFRTRSHWPTGWRRKVFGTSLRDATGGFRQPQIEAWRDTPPHWRTLQRCQHGDLMTAVPNNLLVKVDRSLMAFGIEGRIPFLDHRVVEFGLSLPDHMKIDGRFGKQFLRRWGVQHMPQEAALRPKQGFQVPLGHFLEGKSLHDLKQALLKNPVIAHWFDPKGVAALLDAHRHTGGETDKVWALMNFAIWHRIQVEHAGRQPPLESDPLAFIA